MRSILTMSLMIVLLFSLAIPSMGEEPTGYLCIPDLCTGFRLNESDKWIIAEFSVEGIKFLLTKKDGKWYWNQFGQTSQIECGAFDDVGSIKCKDPVITYSFNKRSLRFDAIQSEGYVIPDPVGAKRLRERYGMRFEPYMMIGTCSPL